MTALHLELEDPQFLPGLSPHDTMVGRLLGFLTCEMGSRNRAPPPASSKGAWGEREVLCKLESTQHTGLLEEKKGPGKL